MKEKISSIVHLFIDLKWGHFLELLATASISIFQKNRSVRGLYLDFKNPYFPFKQSTICYVLLNYSLVSLELVRKQLFLGIIHILSTHQAPICFFFKKKLQYIPFGNLGQMQRKNPPQNVHFNGMTNSFIWNMYVFLNRVTKEITCYRAH